MSLFVHITEVQVAGPDRFNVTLDLENDSAPGQVIKRITMGISHIEKGAINPDTGSLWTVQERKDHYLDPLIASAKKMVNRAEQQAEEIDDVRTFLIGKRYPPV